MILENNAKTVGSATVYNATTGKITRSIKGYGYKQLDVPTGHKVIYGLEADPLSNYIDVETETLVVIPESTSMHHVFDYAKKSWQDARPLHILKNQKWESIKRVRYEKENGQFSWDNSFFDCDQASQLKLQSAAQLAQIMINQNNTSYQLSWILADNSVRTLSATDVINVYVAMQTYITMLYETSQDLRTQIMNVTSSEELEVISWPVMPS